MDNVLDSIHENLKKGIVNSKVEHVQPLAIFITYSDEKIRMDLNDFMFEDSLFHNTIENLKKTGKANQAKDLYLVLEMYRTEDENGNPCTEPYEEAVVIIHETQLTTEAFAIPIKRDNGQIMEIGELTKFEVKEFSKFTNILNVCYGNT